MWTLIGLLLVNYLDMSMSQQTERSYRISMSSEDQIPCAPNTPTSIVQLAAPQAGQPCIPLSVQCPQICQQDPSCISFNYKSYDQACELYGSSTGPVNGTTTFGCTLHIASNELQSWVGKHYVITILSLL